MVCPSITALVDTTSPEKHARSQWSVTDDATQRRRCVTQRGSRRTQVILAYAALRNAVEPPQAASNTSVRRARSASGREKEALRSLPCRQRAPTLCSAVLRQLPKWGRADSAAGTMAGWGDQE